MSERYEAVIVISTKAALQYAVTQSRIDIPFAIYELRPTIFALDLVTPRRVIDDALMPRVARIISRQLGKALTVLYDNQIGWCAAYLYERGTFIREYTEADELWVLLDEDGMPQHNGPTFHIHERADDHEYDCMVSAIDVGLRAMEVDPSLTSESIKEVLCYPIDR